jgi:hypothetical protein
MASLRLGALFLLDDFHRPQQAGRKKLRILSEPIIVVYPSYFLCAGLQVTDYPVSPRDLRL